MLTWFRLALHICALMTAKTLFQFIDINTNIWCITIVDKFYPSFSSAVHPLDATFHFNSRKETESATNAPNEVRIKKILLLEELEDCSQSTKVGGNSCRRTSQQHPVLLQYEEFDCILTGARNGRELQF